MRNLESRILECWNSSFLDYENKKNIFDRPLFILLTGLPGSGKSTLAKKISAETNIPHLDFSIFCKDVLGYHPKLSAHYQSIGKVIDECVYDHLKKGGSLIYDTTCINKLMRKHHFKYVPKDMTKLLIWVSTNEEICRNRLANRQENERPDIRYNSFRRSINLTRTFNDFCKEFEEPDKYISGDNSRSTLEIINDIEKLIK